MSSIAVRASAAFPGAAGHAGIPAQPGARRPGTVRLRVTARGRRVLLALAAAPLAAGLAVSVFAGGSALASGEQSAAVSFETVTVLPDDTLWSIAAEVAPGVDPREVIGDIQRLNNLTSGMIQVGAELAIPLKYSN